MLLGLMKTNFTSPTNILACAAGSCCISPTYSTVILTFENLADCSIMIAVGGLMHNAILLSIPKTSLANYKNQYTMKMKPKG